MVVETVEPTFDAQGYTTYKCSRCDATENGDYTAAKVAAAEVDGVKYTTLTEAVAAAQAGATVTLMADADDAIAVAKELTIAKNGFAATGITAVDGYAVLSDLDGNYVIGKAPTATVNDLGATTVAATMICANLAGIKVFCTGGIGGVHRKAQ